ncbi:tryptophan halogenase family protein [Sphingomonas hengshuiensis]|uniref:Tryptophan halogenase n=1 Tax=Sphingomonas hengshuiensis TaxID=1609977 RepID=A0A7U4J7N0_9SPHN|nr:tryptophan halogenase family protein [Sphingomonas hengshuiensis]AJP71745.1 tryptophan halogenase [Sphingomonas hengshuiensis]
MNRPRVQRVVVAGGGTAGWVAAAALVKQLGPLLDITLVESDEIGTVGVGESTIPTSRSFHQLLGIDEAAVMRATQATFKLAISFENWRQEGDRYFHAFGENGRRSTWMADFHHFWLEARAQGFGGDLADYCFELQAASERRFTNGEDAPINYAYHLDATRYARFLRTLSEPAGVRRVEGKIAQVEQDGESGFVTALVLESGERIEGDLFVDCTGFRGLLIEQTLKTGYEDWTHWLATDTAIAVQTRATEPAVPYTRAIAHQAGWRWKIPLQHRVGNGIVYASAHLSDDAARAQLLGAVEGDVLTEPRLIRYRTGRRRKAWNKNVVSLGLASGFIEPLESTSIHFVKIAVMRLIQAFPFAGISDAQVDRFNAMSVQEVERVRDFIILHYHLTEREDSAFWRQCRDMTIPDTLAERMALFAESGQAYQAGDELFRVDSWVQVLMGQGMAPQRHHELARLMPKEQLRGALDSLKADIAGRVAKMPAHAQFVDRYCGAGEG